MGRNSNFTPTVEVKILQTWELSGAGMISIYHSPSMNDMIDIDREIFSKHPFLGFWD